MENDERLPNIVRRLGEKIAYALFDIGQADDDAEPIEHLRVFSEMYKNFSQGGLPNFQEDFDAAFEIAQAQIKIDYGRPSPSSDYAKGHLEENSPDPR